MARRPYSGRTTSPYGPRKAPVAGASTFHAGLDGVGDYYNRAPEAGVVTWYGYSGGWGNLIKFRDDSGTVHYLAHNAPGGLLAPVGSRQLEGAALGVKGMTGTATGVHVHWETRPGGGATINPETWLASQGGTAGGGSVPVAVETPEKENDMLVYQINNGGLKGTIWGLAPGAMFGAPDAASGLLMAKDWNPTGALIARSEAEVRTIAGLLGIPSNLISAATGGVNWSWAKDAVALAKPSTGAGAVLAATLGDAELARIADAVRARIIKE